MDSPKIAKRKPHVMKVEPGNYAWCACGLSNDQPFCDGSHKKTSIKPIVEKIETTKNVAWCQCKQSGEAPFCDGTHHKL